MVDYSSLDKFLHRLALGSRMRAEVLHDLERGTFLKSAPPDEGRHVFVCGLARAGTTILMREIHGSGEFGSLTYADMPFVLAPNLWQRLSGNGGEAGPKAERAHGDGIAVDFHSPEALDEVYWRISRAATTSLRTVLCRMCRRRTGRRIPRFDAAGAAPYRQVPLSEQEQQSSAAPGDAGARIPGFGDPRFRCRDPMDHARSLLNQHRRFLGSDGFTRAYMGWLGHHEFGDTHRPFAWDAAAVAGDPQELDYWLAQWIAAHRRIEALEREHENIQLVPYHALTSDAGTWPAIARRIGIAAAPLKEIRFSPDKSGGHSTEEAEDEATILYRHLDDRARQSLDA